MGRRKRLLLRLYSSSPLPSRTVLTYLKGPFDDQREVSDPEVVTLAAGQRKRDLLEQWQFEAEMKRVGKSVT